MTDSESFDVPEVPREHKVCTHDGVEFVVPKKMVEESLLIRTCFENKDGDVPCISIHSSSFSKLVKYYESIERAERGESAESIDERNKALVNGDMQYLFTMMTGANYLGLPEPVLALFGAGIKSLTGGVAIDKLPNLFVGCVRPTKPYALWSS